MKNNIQVSVAVVCDDIDENQCVRLTEWILQDEKCTVPWTISLVFVDDRFIIELNQRFFQKSTPTDVISFNLTDDPKTPEGEIYISVDTAARHAKEYEVTLANELLRLVAHGVYHLLDYDDATEPQREAMTALENKALEYVQTAL